MEHAQVSPIQVSPQGDGADRPFTVHDLGTLPGPRTVHIEKSFPRTFAGQPSAVIESYMVQSLKSQCLRDAGQVLNAIERACFLDVMPSWERLLKTAGVTISHIARWYPKGPVLFSDMRVAVIVALCYADQVDTAIGLQKWADADALLRGCALQAAHAVESRLHPSDPDFTLHTMHSAAYRAFAIGRAL